MMGQEMVKPLFLTDDEAILAAKGKLTAIVRRITEPVSCHDQHGHPHEPMICHRGCWYKPEEYSPFGKPGDVLAGKETWGYGKAGHHCSGNILYKVDKNVGLYGIQRTPDVWRSPILMPSWAVRYWFRKKTVRAITGKQLNTGEHYTALHNYGESKLVSGNTWLWYAELERTEKP